AGSGSSVVGVFGNEIRVMQFDEALSMKRTINMDYYELANVLSNL
ncbi:MAG TPA: ATP-dependent 6-phosphofructokinase, partial [Firmicutes bacterium]|nr:ATP-dependent 6-phosphofructokinase [Bacillota bacterium]